MLVEINFMVTIVYRMIYVKNNPSCKIWKLKLCIEVKASGFSASAAIPLILKRSFHVALREILRLFCLRV